MNTKNKKPDLSSLSTEKLLAELYRRNENDLTDMTKMELSDEQMVPAKH